VRLAHVAIAAQFSIKLSFFKKKWEDQKRQYVDDVLPSFLYNQVEIIEHVRRERQGTTKFSFG
jgi:hypothetical protein